MKGKRLYSTMIAIACLAGVFSVNAYQIDCPKEMSFKIKFEEIPEGWEISEDKTYTSSFSTLGLFHDKPALKASLVPAKGTIDGQQQKLIWEVNHVKDTTPYYVVCQYGSGVAITKKIDLSMKSCWAVYSEDKDGKQGALHCSVNEAKNLH